MTYPFLPWDGWKGQGTIIFKANFLYVRKPKNLKINLRFAKETQGYIDVLLKFLKGECNHWMKSFYLLYSCLKKGIKTFDLINKLNFNSFSHLIFSKKVKHVIKRMVFVFGSILNLIIIRRWYWQMKRYLMTEMKFRMEVNERRERRRRLQALLEGRRLGNKIIQHISTSFPT